MEFVSVWIGRELQISIGDYCCEIY